MLGRPWDLYNSLRAASHAFAVAASDVRVADGRFVSPGSAGDRVLDRCLLTRAFGRTLSIDGVERVVAATAEQRGAASLQAGGQRGLDEVIVSVLAVGTRVAGRADAVRARATEQGTGAGENIRTGQPTKLAVAAQLVGP